MSVTRNRPADADHAPGKGAWDSVYAFLASVRFTIFLLSLIAVGSVFGTLIPQGASPEEYLSRYSESTFGFIKFFNLDDTYHSPWFYCLIALFIINLVLCTASRLSRFLASDRKSATLPDEKALESMENHFVGEGKSLADVEKVLKKSYRPVGSHPDGAVYERGGLSRYGVFVIHASIILILLGGFLGALFGFKGHMTLVKGETGDRVALRGENGGERTLGFTLRCEDFSVAFYPGGEPKDYVSTLKVLDKGKTVAEKQVRVNNPLYYKGVHVYQASYGITPSFLFRIGGERVILRGRDTYRKGNLLLMVVRFEKKVHDFGPGVLIAYLDNGQPRTSWFLKNVDNLRQKKLAGVDIRLEEIKEDYYTGLEVSKDPGVWVVWVGFALMLFGLYTNFFIYYRRVYVRRRGEGVIVAGMAPKRKELFREDFARIKTKVLGYES